MNAHGVFPSNSFHCFSESPDSRHGSAGTRELPFNEIISPLRLEVWNVSTKWSFCLHFKRTEATLIWENTLLTCVIHWYRTWSCDWNAQNNQVIIQTEQLLNKACHLVQQDIPPLPPPLLLSLPCVTCSFIDVSGWALLVHPVRK